VIPRTNKELHRLEDNHNDWDSVPVTKLSYWQRLAKKTNGFLTPGNAITLIGTVLVIDGLVDFAAGNRIIGTIKVVTGRVSDILDGIVAARTRTKGRIGRDLDPTADIMQLIIGVALLGHAKILPLFLIIFVGASS
jgi:phosphatidylglycerophosphate synthase